MIINLSSIIAFMSNLMKYGKRSGARSDDEEDVEGNSFSVVLWEIKITLRTLPGFSAESSLAFGVDVVHNTRLS